MPEDYVGSDNHGPGLRTRGTGRTISSIVWGGNAREVTSEHGEACGYCGSTWPNNVGMPTNTHPGMDISMNSGTPLVAAAAGRVEFADFDPQYYRPHHVDVITDDGQRHIYAHLSTIAPGVVAGNRVNAGQPLGTSGEQTAPGTTTPDGTGGHLHFEARINATNKAIDPEPILTQQGPGPEEPEFANGDRIEVVDGPLHLREHGNLQGAVLDSLAAGTALTVTGGPVQHDGYAWYRVDVAGGDKKGWVAGRYCRRAN